MKNILIGFISCLMIILMCSYSYRVHFNTVNVRTVSEDGHKYVVATMTNEVSSKTSGISIVHSANCYCLKKK